MKRVLIFLLFGSLVGCAAEPIAAPDPDCEIPELTLKSCIEPDLAKIAKHPLGSPSNPVRVFQAAGERRYLDSLLCDDMTAPNYRRAGSPGVGPYGFMLDLYLVQCTAEGERKVYMDMYHRGYVETRPASGFEFAK